MLVSNGSPAFQAGRDHYDYQTRYLLFTKGGSVSTLSDSDLMTLRIRGVVVEDGGYGTNIELNTEGVAWLFNYLYTSDDREGKLSKKLLKKIAKFSPEAEKVRDIRFKFVKLPAYDDQSYYMLVIYLNGSPPKAIHSFFPNVCSVPSLFVVDNSAGGFLGVRDDQSVYIRFSSDEISSLEDEKVITVSICKEN